MVHSAVVVKYYTSVLKLVPDLKPELTFLVTWVQQKQAVTTSGPFKLILYGELVTKQLLVYTSNSYGAT